MEAGKHLLQQHNTSLNMLRNLEKLEQKAVANTCAQICKSTTWFRKRVEGKMKRFNEYCSNVKTLNCKCYATLCSAVMAGI